MPNWSETFDSPCTSKSLRVIVAVRIRVSCCLVLESVEFGALRTIEVEKKSKIFNLAYNRHFKFHNSSPVNFQSLLSFSFFHLLTKVPPVPESLQLVVGLKNSHPSKKKCHRRQTRGAARIISHRTFRAPHISAQQEWIFYARVARSTCFFFEKCLLLSHASCLITYADVDVGLLVCWTCVLRNELFLLTAYHFPPEKMTGLRGHFCLHLHFISLL